MYPQKGGTSSNPMIIGAYGDGPNPIFGNNGTSGVTIDGKDMDNTGHYIFQDMEIRDCSKHGLRLRENGVNNITVRRIDFYNVGDYGVHIEHTNTFSIENCRYFNGGRSGFLVQGSENEYATNGRLFNLTVDGAGVDGIVFHYKGTDEGNMVGSNMWIENVRNQSTSQPLCEQCEDIRLRPGRYCSRTCYQIRDL
jgi:hypothetical protein